MNTIVLEELGGGFGHGVRQTCPLVERDTILFFIHENPGLF